MDKIKISQDAFQKAILELQAVQNSLESHKLGMTNTYLLMRSGWKGFAGEAFEVQYKKIIKNLELNILHLSKHINDLKYVAQTLAQVDQDLAWSILAGGSALHVRTAFESNGCSVDWFEGKTAGTSTIRITAEDGSESDLFEGVDYYIGTDGKAYFYNNVRAILEANGAQVDYKKTDGGGSTITVTKMGFSYTLVEGEDYYIGKDEKAHFLDSETYGPLSPAAIAQKSGNAAGQSSASETGGTISTSSPSNNITSTGNAKVNFASGINSSVVSDYAIRILGEIAANAGETSIKITSTIRTAQAQAGAMYDNANRTGSSWEEQRNLYAETGQSVFDKGKEAQKAARAANSNISDSELRDIVTAAMEKEILAQLEKGKSTSKHLVTPEQYAKLNVIDIGYGSVTDKNAFIKELEKAKNDGTISKYIEEPENGCIHIEIPVK